MPIGINKVALCDVPLVKHERFHLGYSNTVIIFSFTGLSFGDIGRTMSLTVFVILKVFYCFSGCFHIRIMEFKYFGGNLDVVFADSSS